ncbi:hypothetical protein BaRGS_00036883 [Batillaria attramentaria]|uniref:Uncharacterized protein n=1 Tax=Batillaria attramentaria TaxID=370345 RepID=A0ABD0JAN7_9CAEN
MPTCRQHKEDKSRNINAASRPFATTLSEPLAPHKTSAGIPTSIRSAVSAGEPERRRSPKRLTGCDRQSHTLKIRRKGELVQKHEKQSPNFPMRFHTTEHHESRLYSLAGAILSKFVSLAS